MCVVREFLGSGRFGGGLIDIANGFRLTLDGTGAGIQLFAEDLGATILIMPFGGFLTCIYLGWFAPRKTVRDEFTNWGTLSGRFFSLYLLLVRFVCPICIMLIFLNQLGLIG